MDNIKATEQLIVFSRYIGQQVVINDLLNSDEEIIGTLIGIKEILKPLKRLTSAIISTANNLPVQAFITPYYQSLGFDMPVFIAPGHPGNCKYVVELNMADYRSAEEIELQNRALLRVHA